MGLCNTERYERIIYACEKLNNLKYAFKDEFMFEKFYDLLDQIWPCALKSFEANGLWLFGTSSMDDKPSGPYNPWEVALKKHFDEERSKHEYKIDLSEVHILEVDYDLGTFVLYTKCYNNKLLKEVLEVQNWSESCTYGIKRYDDDFAKGFQKLSDLISKIQGECFSVFKENQAYASAFLARKCVIKILRDFEDLEKFAQSNRLLSLDLCTSSRLPLFNLMEYHRILFKGECKNHKGEDLEKASNQTKFLIFVDLLMGGLKGDRDIGMLLEICHKNGSTDNAEILHRILESQKKNKEKEKEDSNRHNDNSHMYFVNGFDWDKTEEEIMEKRKREKEFWEERETRLKEAKEKDLSRKKTPAKKTPAKKTPAKKTTRKKTTTAKKTPDKKATKKKEKSAPTKSTKNNQNK